MMVEKAACIDETCSVACSTSTSELHECVYAPFGGRRRTSPRWPPRPGADVGRPAPGRGWSCGPPAVVSAGSPCRRGGAGLGGQAGEVGRWLAGQGGRHVVVEDEGREGAAVHRAAVEPVGHR